VLRYLSAFLLFASAPAWADGNMQWICHGPADYQVTVWQGDDRTMDNFVVHVTVGENRQEQTVAVVDRVGASVEDDFLIFAADDEPGRLSLALDQSESVFDDVPAMLKLRHPDARLPRDRLTLPLLCDQPIH
jgi:hypothetical protein